MLTHSTGWVIGAPLVNDIKGSVDEACPPRTHYAHVTSCDLLPHKRTEFACLSVKPQCHIHAPLCADQSTEAWTKCISGRGIFKWISLRKNNYMITIMMTTLIMTMVVIMMMVLVIISITIIIIMIIIMIALTMMVRIRIRITTTMLMISMMLMIMKIVMMILILLLMMTITMTITAIKRWRRRRWRLQL